MGSDRRGSFPWVAMAVVAMTAVVDPEQMQTHIKPRFSCPSKNHAAVTIFAIFSMRFTCKFPTENAENGLT